MAPYCLVSAAIRQALIGASLVRAAFERAQKPGDDLESGRRVQKVCRLAAAQRRLRTLDPGPQPLCGIESPGSLGGAVGDDAFGDPQQPDHAHSSLTSAACHEPPGRGLACGSGLRHTEDFKRASGGKSKVLREVLEKDAGNPFTLDFDTFQGRRIDDRFDVLDVARTAALTLVGDVPGFARRPGGTRSFFLQNVPAKTYR